MLFLDIGKCRVYSIRIQPDKVMTILHTDTAALTETLFGLERCGKYEEAFAEVSVFWTDTGKSPEVDDLAPRSAAEVLLRCGSLIGFYGHNRQLPDSQEVSKNLLTQAHQRFTALDNVEKAAECENYLALAYWRTGELTEAETWISEALSRKIPASSQTRIYSYICKSLILLSMSRYEDVISYLGKLEEQVKESGDAFLKGSFCTNLGIAYQETRKFAEALRYYSLARYYHHRSAHKIYLGTVENNLAQLYKFTGKFDKAHRAIDNAARIFEQIGDKTRTGFSLDTKALIFFEEGKYTESLNTAEKAIEILRRSENSAYLIETLWTKTKIHLNLDDFTSAILSLSEAVQIARQNTGDEAAENIAREFEKLLDERNAAVGKTESGERDSIGNGLNLLLPASLSHYEDIQGVWIRNSHLAEIGLEKNSLAIVADAPLERGELAAISENATDEVYCGFYDADFGIICLEGIRSEPRLFDVNEITVLGKIVGVATKSKDSGGKMIVKPLNL